ncbi:uncharacterized protein LOC111674061, partial [Orussus abietinus]|uniref:uncharacterized protein LOC111674061 n=1 Tax=Orussus abietinus TaxID=222816 RepID=UPI000C715AA1
ILEIICVCLCTSTFTFYVYIVNNFTAGQFKILHQMLEVSYTLHLPDASSNLGESDFQITSYDARTNLGNCLGRYRLLIYYIKTMESLYSFTMLTQNFSFVFQMCFWGFQIMLARNGLQVRDYSQRLNIEYCTKRILQIFMFASFCDEIIISSIAKRKAFRQGLLILVCTARHPYILTVGEFCSMWMDTFKSILSMAVSYFMVLRQVNESKSVDH